MSDRNEEIKNLTFENKLPAVCLLGASESQNDEEVFPLLLMLPRAHYLSLYLPRIHEHFCKYLNGLVQLEDLVLSYHNTPLDPDLFFGVFFDLHFFEYSNTLPLRLQVTYRPNQVARSLSPKEVYTYDLKQASCIKFRNKAYQILFDLQSEEYDRLWDSFVSQNYPQFNQTWTLIWDAYSNKQVEQQLPLLPLRLYIRGVPGRLQQQVPLEEGSTLQHLLQALLPRLFQEGALAEEFSQTKFVSHGVVLDLGMDALTFYHNFYHFDGFAYLVVIP